MVVLTCGSYGNVIRLLPPLVIDEALLADGLAVLAGAADEVLGAARLTVSRRPGRPGVSAWRWREHRPGRGQPGVEALDLVVGVADQVPDPLTGGVAGRRHRGLLDVAGRPHHLDGLCGHLAGHRAGRLDPQHLVQPDRHLRGGGGRAREARPSAPGLGGRPHRGVGLVDRPPQLLAHLAGRPPVDVVGEPRLRGA